MLQRKGQWGAGDPRLVPVTKESARGSNVLRKGRGGAAALRTQRVSSELRRVDTLVTRERGISSRHSGFSTVRRDLDIF